MNLKKKQEKRKTLAYNLNFYSNAAAQIDHNSSQNEIVNRIEVMRNTFKQFSDILIKLETETEYDVEPDREQNMMIENEYVKAISKLQAMKIEEEPTPTPFGGPFDSTHIFQELNHTHFDIPTFDGKFDEWKSFKELFIAAMIATRLTDAQKLQKLKGLLRSDAFNTIRHLSITNENYRVAMNLLNNRFENKRAIVNKHLQLFFSIQKIPTASASSLRKIVDTMNECIYSLNAMQVSTESWSPIIIHYIETKFDRKTYLDWEYYLKGTTDIPSIDQLTRFLETQTRMLEAVERNDMEEKKMIQSLTMVKTMPTNNSTAATSTASKITYKCHMCSESHRLNECSTFRAKSLSDRQNFITHKKLCENCLSGTHTTNDCKSKFRCLRCSEKHHSLIHVDKKIAAHTEVEPQHEVYSDEEEQSDEHAEGNDQIEVNLAHTHSHVLLATAMIHIRMKTKNKCIKVRALLDQGSQGSFISESVSQQLKLKKRKANISVSGIVTAIP